MSYNPSVFPDASPSPPPLKKGCGCMSFVMAGCGLVLAVILAIWIILMHSPLPMRMLAGLLAESETDPVIMRGIKGSASSGYRIDEIEAGGNIFEDVRFHSSGVIRMLQKQELIISEIHVGKARITTDFRDSEPDASETSESDAQQSEPDFYFQLDKLSLNNTVITDRASGFELEIPELVWTGFKAGKGQFEFGDIRIDSNVLKLATTKQGSSQWLIDATLMPAIDERLLLPVSMRLVITRDGEDFSTHIVAFNGVVHIGTEADGSQTTLVNGLDLTKYIDAPVPGDIRLDMTKRVVDGAAVTEVGSGSFRLGITPFTIEPTQADASEIVATASQGGIAFRIAGPMNDGDAKPLVTSTPPMSPQDMLARIYHGADDAGLDAKQREQLAPALEWFRFNEN